ncbi:MOSC domain-containing protein [Nocardioides sp. GY 10127]|uniref:MOSC domain-containing protein n=1 Tax=Nocardioides sp. GY 10127 TaxID=2569762 RepID=UPI0010A871B1|nr:MOSC domain-containing protein [Nocardioides sp. GY 10127]TIC85401.1 MOSC domain-containing protein [Nocardioides sp. GY 10127]
MTPQSSPGDGRSPVVQAVHRSPEHAFSKEPAAAVTLVPGIGVDGDAHAGSTVQHRSRVAQDPTQPNLRQVHLIAGELLDELAEAGFEVGPGQLGENLTTRGIDLVDLPVGTVLGLGDGALVALTGLRNPCVQIQEFSPGLLGHLVRRGEDGTVERRGGVMGVVLAGGEVRPGDDIRVALPPEPHRPMDRV